MPTRKKKAQPANPKKGKKQASALTKNRIERKMLLEDNPIPRPGVETISISAVYAAFSPERNVGYIKFAYSGSVKEYKDLSADAFNATLALLSWKKCEFNGQYIIINTNL